MTYGNDFVIMTIQNPSPYVVEFVPIFVQQPKNLNEVADNLDMPGVIITVSLSTPTPTPIPTSRDCTTVCWWGAPQSSQDCSCDCSGISCGENAQDPSLSMGKMYADNCGCNCIKRCVSGASQDNHCGCDCSKLPPCPNGAEFFPDCSCPCDLNCGQGSVTTGCMCDCSGVSCPGGQAPSPLDGCQCLPLSITELMDPGLRPLQSVATAETVPVPSAQQQQTFPFSCSTYWCAIAMKVFDWFMALFG